MIGGFGVESVSWMAYHAFLCAEGADFAVIACIGEKAVLDYRRLDPR